MITGTTTKYMYILDVEKTFMTLLPSWLLISNYLLTFAMPLVSIIVSRVKVQTSSWRAGGILSKQRTIGFLDIALRATRLPKAYLSYEA